MALSWWRRRELNPGLARNLVKRLHAYSIDSVWTHKTVHIFPFDLTTVGGSLPLFA